MTLTLDNLVSYWSLEEASGTRVDAHGSNDLGQSGGVGSVTGIQGNAADFDRTLSQKLNISDAAQSGLDIAGNITVCAWVRAASLPSATGTFFGIAGKYRFSANFSYWLAAHPGNPFIFRVSSNGTSVTTIFGSSVTPATRQFVCARYDGSFLRLRVNTTDAAPVAFASPLFNGVGDFTVGGVDGSAAYFDGDIDEVSVWNEFAPDTFVDTLYNSGAGLSYANTVSILQPVKAFQSAWNVRALAEKTLQSAWNARRTYKGSATVTDSAVSTATISDGAVATATVSDS